MLGLLHKYKFEIFLASQMAILFGSLLVPAGVFDIISPMLFFINIIAGCLFLGTKGKSQGWIIIAVLILIVGIFSVAGSDGRPDLFDYLKIGVLFLFHVSVTFKIIKEIWRAEVINRNVILGLMSGFISLGLVGFFMCLSIEFINPNSFSQLPTMIHVETDVLTDRLMYFSFITLLTIGYGDMLPLTALAQKATVLIGLVGQFYLVIITAIVVGKFINQNTIHQKKNLE